MREKLYVGIVFSIETYPFLRLNVVLHCSSDAPGCHSSQPPLLAPQEPHQRRPQAQCLHIVRVVHVLNKLFEIVERYELVLKGHVLGLNCGHGFSHQVRIAGPAHENFQCFRVEGLTGWTFCFGITGCGWVVASDNGIFDAPFEELVQAWVHGRDDCESIEISDLLLDWCNRLWRSGDGMKSPCQKLEI